MKHSVARFINLGLLVLLLVVKIINCVSNANPAYKSCRTDNPCTCGLTSPVSEMICFSNYRSDGFQYGFFGFNNGIVALCGIHVDCELGKRCDLHVIDVYGYFVNLTYPMKVGTKTKYSANLWYIDTSVPGCPQVSVVKNSKYVLESFTPTVPHTSVHQDLAYLIFAEMENRESDYNAQCNVLPSTEGREYGCSWGSKSSIGCQKPITGISLAHTKSCLFYNLPGKTTGTNIRNTLGLSVTCNLPDDAEPLSDPPVLRETCTSNDSIRSLYCRDFQKSTNINDILRSYGYDGQLAQLNAQKACTISTLWAQGKYKNADYSSCNCDSSNGCYTTIVLRPLDTSDPNRYVSTYVLLSGYTEKHFKEEILSEFLKIC